MDILFSDSGDGGALTLDGGDLKGDGTLLNSIYLSLFNGDNFSNVFEDYETNGEFEAALCESITAEHLKAVENKGQEALKWMIDENVAESVEFYAYGDSSEKINVEITITEPKGNQSTFSIIWENEKVYLKAK